MKTVFALPMAAAGILLCAQALQASSRNDSTRDWFERWHEEIRTTVFWVGEPPGTIGTPLGNRCSAWDPNWKENYGGTDHPLRRNGFFPADFLPRENPFYVALPFNDLATKARSHPLVVAFREAVRSVLPAEPARRSLCKNRWIAVTYGNRTCYAQWQDVGPIYQDDYAYVLGFQQPRSHSIGMAGLDVSPAVRDFLKFPGRGRTDWKFVEDSEVPEGPWLEIVTGGDRPSSAPRVAERDPLLGPKQKNQRKES